MCYITLVLAASVVGILEEVDEAPSTDDATLFHTRVDRIIERCSILQSLKQKIDQEDSDTPPKKRTKSLEL